MQTEYSAALQKRNPTPSAIGDSSQWRVTVYHRKRISSAAARSRTRPSTSRRRGMLSADGFAAPQPEWIIPFIAKVRRPSECRNSTISSASCAFSSTSVVFVMVCRPRSRQVRTPATVSSKASAQTIRLCSSGRCEASVICA